MRPSRVSTKVTTPTAPAHEADAERRHEHRFQVSESIARLVMRTTANNLPLSRDDRPYQWSTTTYCDTVSWNIFRAAEKGSAMQLRIREYHRTRPREVLNPGTAWIEFKDDEQDTSLKERFGVSMDVAPSIFRSRTGRQPSLAAPYPSGSASIVRPDAAPTKLILTASAISWPPSSWGERR